MTTKNYYECSICGRAVLEHEADPVVTALHKIFQPNPYVMRTVFILKDGTSFVDNKTLAAIRKVEHLCERCGRKLGRNLATAAVDWMKECIKDAEMRAEGLSPEDCVDDTTKDHL
jgi:hypothetical protein